jgi:hypothetical protein
MKPSPEFGDSLPFVPMSNCGISIGLKPGLSKHGIKLIPGEPENDYTYFSQSPKPKKLHRA